MRRLLTFTCEGEQCAGTLDAAPGRCGILLVTGGREPRIGGHRWQADLAALLAGSGYPVFRFDRRGVGDSGGIDPGFDRSGPDVLAAIACFRSEVPHLDQVIALGNCDAATTLALSAPDLPVSGLLLLNPWVGEHAEDDGPALPSAAAIRSRYRERLFRPDTWKRLVTGRLNIVAALKGLRRAAQSDPVPPLASRMYDRLSKGDCWAHAILVEHDPTAISFRAINDAQRGLTIPVTILPTRSHSFADPGDLERLAASCVDILRLNGCS